MLAAALLPALAQAQDGRYIIKFKPEVSNGRAVVEAAGGKVLKTLDPQNAVAARLPEAALKGLQASGKVEYAEVDQPRKPLAQTTPYGVPMVQADQVWPSATGANRKVCIIDSGYYMGHEDLQTSNITGYPTGWDKDLCGHGSHVAGTIAALNNSTGVVGVLPNGVNLHIIKVFGDDCSWTYSSDLVDALNRCVSAGSNVVSMSLGGGRASNTERNAFDNAWSKGVLSIAAAGNDGTTAKSYPASYTSVVSVGALDSNKQIASFSQFNAEVDIAAPGVGVLSTVGERSTNTLTVNGSTYAGGAVEFAASTTTSGVAGTVVDGGICDTVGAWSGKVVLCQRGTISFYDKVMNVQNGGGVATVIYNNVSGPFNGTLGAGNTSLIPAITLSMEDGQTLVSSAVGQSGTVVSTLEKPASGYAYYDGTSMATPHVSAVAALVWSYNTGWTNVQVRDALEKTAEDLGTAGRDDYYGHGLVRAKAALDYLTGNSGGGGDTTAPTTSITAPTAGATVSGTVTYSADASDNVGVSKVDFYVGSTLVGSDSASPFSIGWDSTKFANGGYSLTTKAYDAAGNVATSAAVSVTVSNSTGSCSVTEQVLLNPGFESGNVNWVADSGVITSSSTNARTGSYLAWLNGYAKANSDFAYQDVTIPSGACGATFKYWLKITTAETTTTTAYDKLTVTVRDTSNNVLATLANYSNLNKSADYVEFSFDLKAYAGKTVRLYFYGTEDRSYATSFFVDDSSLTITK